MNYLLWMLADNNGGDSGAGAGGTGTGTGSDVTSLTSSAESLWTGTVLPILNIVIWVLVGILGVVFIAKAIMTAMAVMKAADEPQVRQEKINGFKYLAIALGIAIVVLSLAGTLLGLLGNNKSVLGNGKEASFLF